MAECTNRTYKYEEHEVLKEIKTYIITMPCSKCDGEMKFTGMSYMTNPARNVHKCNKCGYEEQFSGVTYPRIDYR